MKKVNVGLAICIVLFHFNFVFAYSSGPQKIQKVQATFDPHKITNGFWYNSSRLKKCERWLIADGIGWPEYRTVTDLCCIHTPLGDVCSNCPKCETRWCEKKYYVQICYDNLDPNTVNKCAISAAAIAAPALPNISVATELFVKAFVICVGSDAVTISIQEESSCGDWHNCTK